MEDRLSSLPDELISRVLSFLPPKMFMQTSILAKAWRFHWSRVPRFIVTTKTIDEVQILSQSLNLFHISGPDTSNEEFGSWIATVFASDPRNLVVSLNYQRTLPPFLFSCESLFYLSICDCSGIIPDADGTSVYFPSLKKLELVNVMYTASNSLIHLLSGCPVLEELVIERLNGPFLLYLYSDTITTLVIDTKGTADVSLMISSLRYLRIRVHRSVMNRIFACPLDFLVEADIDFVNVNDYCCPDSVINFVCELHNVKRLALSTRPISIPTSYFSDLFKFHNLTELTLHSDWRFITCFLENADNLRVLTILSMEDFVDSDDPDDPDDPDYCPDQYWMEPKQVPACLVSHLESVSLVDFGWCTEHEFDMAKYILKNAKLLKRMEIKCTQNYQLVWNMKRAINKFGMFDIESRRCELILSIDAKIQL